MIDVCNPGVIRELLARYGFHFSKSKGQNFLTQRWVPERIVQASGIDGSCGVVEIGPGFGPLTQELCLRAGKVVAIEVPGLRPDACANLPYYITSPVLTKLLESRCFSSITVMVQKEVAQRICAAPASKDYSAFTVLCNYHAQPELLFDVPASCFIPQPKVTSAVVCLKTRETPPAQIDDERLFFRTVRAAFAQRRKTLLNALTSGFGELSKADLAAALEVCGIPAAVRGETLDIPTFAALSNELSRRIPHV